MNITLQILQIMGDGKPYTVAELAAALPHITPRQVRIAMDSIKCKKLATAAHLYTVTPEGVSHFLNRPMSVEERREKQRLRNEKNEAKRKENLAKYLAKQAKARAKQLADFKTEPQESEAGIVPSAKVRRHALDMAWMSVAREQEASHV